jgi:hypothetical protein
MTTECASSSFGAAFQSLGNQSFGILKQNGSIVRVICKATPRLLVSLAGLFVCCVPDIHPLLFWRLMYFVALGSLVRRPLSTVSMSIKFD